MYYFINCGMQHLLEIENIFGIDDHNYSFGTNQMGVVSSIEIFDSEYHDFYKFNDDIFEALSIYPDLEYIRIDTQYYTVEDLSKVSLFKKLKSLELECPCNFTDLNPLKDLKSMESISFSEGKSITDLSCLAGLHNLRRIFIFGSNVTNLSPLAGLSKLEQIGLTAAKISDINAIKDLVNLQFLNLNNNNIKDIAILQRLKSLSGVHLGSNNIENVDVLKSLSQLTVLDISNNNVCKLFSFEGISNFRHLDCANNQIEDFSCLSGLDSITTLNISYNPVKDYNSVKLLKGINTLFSNGVSAAAMSETPFQSNISVLHMEACGLKAIQFLQDLTNLHTINLNNNSISDLSIFSDFSHLRTILLLNNDVQKPFPIFYHNGMQELNLRENTFGNKHYGRTSLLGYDAADKLLSFLELQKITAKYYFDKGQYEEALAYYYYGQATIETFEIYVRKFCAVSTEDNYRLGFYFYKLFHVYRATLHLSDYDNQREQLMNELHSKLQTLKQLERNLFMHFLEPNAGRFPYDIVNSYLNYTKRNNNAVDLDGEIYYSLVKTPVDRKHLMNALYYYKLLKKQQSAFCQKLEKDIKKCLQEKFAYTEREEHDKYMKILVQPDVAEIPVPNLDLELEESRVNDYKSFEQKEARAFTLSVFNVFFAIAFIVMGIMMFFVDSDKLKGLPILILLLLAMGKKLQSRV